MSTLRIPTPLRPYTEGVSEIEIQVGSVGQALEQLVSEHPALKPHLFTEAGELRSYVNLFLNDEDVRHMQGVDTSLQEGDHLMILPSIAGG